MHKEQDVCLSEEGVQWVRCYQQGGTLNYHTSDSGTDIQSRALLDSLKRYAR